MLQLTTKLMNIFSYSIITHLFLVIKIIIPVIIHIRIPNMPYQNLYQVSLFNLKERALRGERKFGTFSFAHSNNKP